jgi:hypothetical protein
MPHRPPESNEYSPHHERYISLVTAPVLTALRDQRRTLPQFLCVVSDGDAGYRYADGKWSIREVVGHIFDAERIYQYRALAFARGEVAVLPGYDPDDYVVNSGFDHRTMHSLIDEFLAVRESTLRLFTTLDPSAWDRRGMVSGGFVSVRALAYIAVGHAQRHLNVLSERYGVGSSVAQSQAVSVP